MSLFMTSAVHIIDKGHNSIIITCKQKKSDNNDDKMSKERSFPREAPRTKPVRGQVSRRIKQACLHIEWTFEHMNVVPAGRGWF